MSLCCLWSWIDRHWNVLSLRMKCLSHRLSAVEAREGGGGAVNGCDPWLGWNARHSHPTKRRNRKICQWTGGRTAERGGGRRATCVNGGRERRRGRLHCMPLFYRNINMYFLCVIQLWLAAKANDMTFLQKPTLGLHFILRNSNI